MYTRLRLLSPNYSKSLELNRSRTFTLNSQIFASANAIPQRSFANLPRKRTKKVDEEPVTTEKPSVKSEKYVEISTSGFPSYTEISKFEKKESRKSAQNERTSKLEEIEDSIQESPKSTKSKRSSKSNQTSKSQEIEGSTQKQSKSTKSSNRSSKLEQSQEIEDSIEEIPKSTKSSKSKKSQKSKETENSTQELSTKQPKAKKEKEQQFEGNFVEISDNFVRRNVDHLWKEFYEGTIVLPTNLAEKMRIALEGFPRKQLRQEAEKLSALLRMRTLSETRQRTAGLIGNNAKFTSKPVSLATDKPLKMRERELAPITSQTPLPPVYNENQALAYVIHRMPGVYGCTHRVFNEINSSIDDFSPKNMLDFGSGPGTAIWSATQIWPDLNNILAVEPSSYMTKASEIILDGLPVTRRRYLFSTKQTMQYDLVSASYVLSELKNSQERISTIKNLWKTVSLNGVLVLVEPGTPIGYGIIKEARDILINYNLLQEEDRAIMEQDAEETTEESLENESEENIQNDIKVDEVEVEEIPTKAQMIAPCPHSATCPMTGTKSWCHFPQRVERIPLQKSAKPFINTNWEDEKFSYLVVRKVRQEDSDAVRPAEEQWSRVISPPMKKTGHIITDVCAPDGMIQRRIVAKSDGKENYTATKRATWGDGLVTQNFPERTLKKSHGPVDPKEVAKETRRKEMEFEKERKAARAAEAEKEMSEKKEMLNLAKKIYRDPKSKDEMNKLKDILNDKLKERNEEVDKHEKQKERIRTYMTQPSYTLNKLLEHDPFEKSEEEKKFLEEKKNASKAAKKPTTKIGGYQKRISGPKQ